MRDPINQLPGISSERTAQKRRLFIQSGGLNPITLTGFNVIDGSESRDPGNTGDLDVLRAGNVLGRITSSGLWAPAFVGQITGDYSSGGTTLTVSAAQATELERLVGQSGTNELVCIGAPTESGTVAITAFTHSAINTSTGAITVTSLGVDKHAGSFIAVNDGRYTPLAMVPEGYGIKVTDIDGDSVDVDGHGLAAGGFVDTGQVVLYPDASDTSLIAWLKQQLRLVGVWMFSDDFGL